MEKEQEGMRQDLHGSYQALLVVLSFRIHAHNHPHFSFTVKIVLEEMSQFGISVRDHLKVHKRPLSFHYTRSSSNQR